MNEIEMEEDKKRSDEQSAPAPHDIEDFDGVQGGELQPKK